jgi:hypothetical protein
MVKVNLTAEGIPVTCGQMCKFADRRLVALPREFNRFIKPAAMLWIIA